MTALDTGISINMFYGDPGENVFISKMFQNPYKEHFYHWFLNIIEQNRDQQSFPKMLSRLPEVIEHFFVKLNKALLRGSLTRSKRVQRVPKLARRVRSC